MHLTIARKQKAIVTGRDTTGDDFDMTAQGHPQIRVIILMGVSGSGKTTIGHKLAEVLGWQFADGDDYHSAANKAKMHSGHPLTDEDREPWLATLAGHVRDWSQSDTKTILACSALKASYRDILTQDADRVAVVYLKADFETIAGRLNHRTGHFMNKDLLRSQFDTLEEPEEISKNQLPVIEVDASLPQKQLIDEIVARLK